MTYSLAPGVNLITLPIAPTASAPALVFGPILPRLDYVYERDNANQIWRSFHPGKPAWLNTLTVVQPGFGYVVKLTSGPTVNLQVEGDTPVGATVRTVTGSASGTWNLVGFLGESSPSNPAALWNDPPALWADLWGADADVVLALRGFRANNYYGFNLQVPAFGRDANGNLIIDPDELRWFYTDTSSSGISPLRQLSPQAAYWTRLGRSTVIGPQLQVWMPSDVNQGNETSFPEPAVDEDFNGNRILDYGYSVWDPTAFDYARDAQGRAITATQDTVVFRVPVGAAFRDVPVLTQELSIHNVGDRGNSQIYGYAGNDVLHFRIEADPASASWLEIRPLVGSVRSHTANVAVKLSVRIDALAAGSTYQTAFVIRSNGGNKQITVRAIVPPIAGVYDGSAIAWLGDEAARGTSFLQKNRHLRINIVGGNCTLYAAHTPHVEGDMTLAVTAAGPNGFVAQGTASIAANDPKNVLGVNYQRTIRLEGLRASDEIAYGNDPPLQGVYTETLTDLGADIVWTGRFLLQRWAEPQ